MRRWRLGLSERATACSLAETRLGVRLRYPCPIGGVWRDGQATLRVAWLADLHKRGHGHVMLAGVDVPGDAA